MEKEKETPPPLPFISSLLPNLEMLLKSPRSAVVRRINLRCSLLILINISANYQNMKKSEHQVRLNLPWTILIQIFRPLRTVDFPKHRQHTHTWTIIFHLRTETKLAHPSHKSFVTCKVHIKCEIKSVYLCTFVVFYVFLFVLIILGK